MTISCSNLKSQLSSFSLAKDCDQINEGILRIATPLLYPNGSNVDVFLYPEIDASGTHRLTDLGQTASYLLDAGVKPFSTEKRKQVIADICKSLEVMVDNGELTVRMKALTDLPSAIIRLGQACIRAAELQWSQRLRTLINFREQLEEVISGFDFPYTVGAEIMGKFRKPVKVDYLVQGPRRLSAVNAIATGNEITAHQLSTEVFTRFFDISGVTNSPQLISVYDSTTDIFKEQDLDRLNTLSLVLGFPDQQDDLLKALVA